MPEEVDRTRLAAVPAGELLEDPVRPVEDPPEALDRVGVVGRVLGVLGERRRHRDAERLLADRDVDAEPPQARRGAARRTPRPRARRERERLRCTAARPHDEPVVDEVEVDLERHAGRRVHAARRQPAHVDVERHVPPVVARRRRGQPHLARRSAPTGAACPSSPPSPSSGRAGSSGRLSIAVVICPRRLHDERDLVDEAPAPVLAGLGGARDRMVRPRPRACSRGGSARSRSSRSCRRSGTCAGAPSGRRSSGTPRSRRSTPAARHRDLVEVRAHGWSCHRLSLPSLRSVRS